MYYDFIFVWYTKISISFQLKIYLYFANYVSKEQNRAILL